LIRLVNLIGKLVNGIHLSSTKHLKEKSTIDYDEDCARVFVESGLLRLCCKVYFKYDIVQIPKEGAFRFILVFLCNNILFGKIGFDLYKIHFCDRLVIKFFEEALWRDEMPRDFRHKIKDPLLEGMYGVIETFLKTHKEDRVVNKKKTDCRFCRMTETKTSCPICKVGYCDDICMVLDAPDHVNSCKSKK
jgi:hypothetical protein